MSAVSHEIRNLCGAALVVHKNLTKVSELRGNADFEALGTLIHGLERISTMELRGSSEQRRTAIELTSVLDELRVLIEAVGHEQDISMQWDEIGPVPLVWADRYGLMQVFLNLAKNSIRAMENVETKRLTINTTVHEDSVIVRFEDTGVGIANSAKSFPAVSERCKSHRIGFVRLAGSGQKLWRRSCIRTQGPRLLLCCGIGKSAPSGGGCECLNTRQTFFQTGPA